MSTFTLPSPVLLFVGDEPDRAMIKTACGLADWAPERCVGEWALSDAAASTGLERLSPAAARARGARAVVIGVAPVGGALNPVWLPALLQALEAGLDLVSGMHARLGDTPALADAAARHGRQLIDVRHLPAARQTGTGRRRSGRRLLTVGTDCALGKKYTALAITRALTHRGLAADFRATGQTGIMISGGGIPLDAIPADFLAGAVEALAPDAAPDHWDVIEGQGSLFHPAYAGVTLGLVHGAQPEAMVLCHQPGRTHVHGFPDFLLPSLTEAMDAYLRAARLTSPQVRFAGISLNTYGLDSAAAHAALDQARAETGLPAADPVRGIGLSALIDNCLGSLARAA